MIPIPIFFLAAYALCGLLLLSINRRNHHH